MSIDKLGAGIEEKRGRPHHIFASTVLSISSSVPLIDQLVRRRCVAKRNIKSMWGRH
jgi:hypothetical protein